uniref:Uncharacterized protein n=1 Tax=Parascaris equorum TaxID=6256 RepID=A0A914RCS3_PAREQ
MGVTIIDRNRSSVLTEALVLLDRLHEAVESLTQAVPLQSMPSTISAVIYNRALLQALSGNLHKALSTLAMSGETQLRWIYGRFVM